MRTNKMLIIGLDGASFDILDPLLEEGRLPNIQNILNNGVSGALNSTTPPICATAWASFLTGQNPGKHGVYDFFEFKKNAYKKKVIDVNSIKSPTLWQYLERYDKKMIFMNIPIMFPPKRLNGVAVSGALTPPGKKCAFPESLSRELYRNDYIVDIAYDYIPNLRDFCKYVKKMTAKRFETFLSLLDKYFWDFAMVNFVGAERMQQAIWEHPDLIQEMYIEYDRIIGDLREKVGDEVTMVIMSDHGFTGVDKKFFVNEWLADLDLLAKEIKVGEPSIPEFIKLQFGKWREENMSVNDFLLKSGFTCDKVRSFIPSSLEMLLKKFTPLKIKQVLPREHLIIDWSNTLAYLSSRFSYAININLKGREPSGIVAPGAEYEDTRNYIIRELNRLKDPYTFDYMIDQVYRGEEIFTGQYACDAPDIIFIPKNYAYAIEPDKRSEKSVISNSKDNAPVLSGPHPKGLFMGIGPEFALNQAVDDLKIWDILPNILHLMDLPIPENLDGKVRYDLYKSHSEYAGQQSEYYKFEEEYFNEFIEWNSENDEVDKNWKAWI